MAVAIPTMVSSSPAGATPAPLITQNAVGIRIDETAITGPALTAIKNSLHPFVNEMIRQGAVDGAPLDSYKSLTVTSNLALSVDFLTPSAGRPSGGLSVKADITGIEMRYIADPPWPFADCSIWIRPDAASITASASVDRTKLPAAPLRLDPIQATWDDDPSISTSGVCWSYLIDDAVSGWWDSFTGNDPQSTASKIEAQLNSKAQALIDDTWNQNVKPILDSVNGFGVTVNQLRTDDHGLIVTADLNATNLTIPGFGGPFNVSGAPDSGATSDINTLLANRSTAAGASNIIVSVAPNVANQFLSAITQSTNNNLGAPVLSSSIESVLLNPADRAMYPDGAWSMAMTVQAPPKVAPTGPGGAPQLQLPAMQLEFYNTDFDPFTPVATFAGTMSGIDLKTSIRPNTNKWGPGFSTSGATISVTRIQADDQAANVPAQTSAAILPSAKLAFDDFNTGIFVQFLSLAPLSLYGLNVGLCTTCGRYAGDQRYTETFKVT